MLFFSEKPKASEEGAVKQEEKKKKKGKELKVLDPKSAQNLCKSLSCVWKFLNEQVKLVKYLVSNNLF